MSSPAPGSGLVSVTIYHGRKPRFILNLSLSPESLRSNLFVALVGGSSEHLTILSYVQVSSALVSWSMQRCTGHQRARGKIVLTGLHWQRAQHAKTGTAFQVGRSYGHHGAALTRCFKPAALTCQEAGAGLCKQVGFIWSLLVEVPWETIGGGLG